MCNKICASFPLLSSSGSERGAAARCAGRAGSPRAPGEAGQTQKLGKELSVAREGPKCSCPLALAPHQP